MEKPLKSMEALLILTYAGSDQADAERQLTEDCGLRLPESCPFPLERIVEGPFDRLVAEGKLA